MLSKTEFPGVTNIETDHQIYSQTGSEFRVCNINGHAMLPDSTVQCKNGIEDEQDFILHFTALEHIQKQFFENLSSICPSFENMSGIDKIILKDAIHFMQ